MEWTREQRYLPYEKHSALELLRLQAQAANSSYQMQLWLAERSKWLFLLQ